MLKKPSELLFLTALFHVLLLTLYLSTLFIIFGFRSDFISRIGQNTFQIEIFLVIFTIFSSIFGLNFLRFPDLRQKNWIKYLPFISFIPFLALIIYQYSYHDHNMNLVKCGVDGYYCTLSIMAFSLIPAIILFFTLYQGTTLHKKLSGMTIGITSGSISYLALRLIHETENISHLFIWHFTPTFLLIIICILFTKKIIKKI